MGAPPARPGKTPVTLQGSDELVFYLGGPDAALRICAGHCTVHLPPGEHALSLGQGFEDPVSAGTIQVSDEAVTAFGIFEEADTTASVIAMSTGLLLGGSLAVSGATLWLASSNSTDGDVGFGVMLGGLGLTGVGILVSLLLADEDRAEVFQGRVEF